MTFRGWPAEAFDFYARLEADNTRAFWQANRDAYQQSVRTPFDELSDTIAATRGPLHLFRPYRDVRFAKDKTPYKTSAGAVTESDGGAMYYVELRPQGLYVGCGMYSLAADQLDRWRAAVDHETTGPEIEAIVAELRGAGREIGAMETLKTSPRGWPRDHPRVTLLRQKGLIVGRAMPRAKWMHTAKALDRLEAEWTLAEPLCRWLESHVGPSTLPPAEWG